MTITFNQNEERTNNEEGEAVRLHNELMYKPATTRLDTATGITHPVPAKVGLIHENPSFEEMKALYQNPNWKLSPSLQNHLFRWMYEKYPTETENWRGAQGYGRVIDDELKAIRDDVRHDIDWLGRVGFGEEVWLTNIGKKYKSTLVKTGSKNIISVIR